MIRYPYTLEMWYEEDATQNPDGSWNEGTHEWRVVARCNARQNGQAQQIKGQNGDAFLYSFEVTMPANTQPIPIRDQSAHLRQPRIQHLRPYAAQ